MKKILITIAVAAAFSACMNQGGKNATDNQAAKNEEMLRKFADEIINKHSVALIDSLVAPDFVEHEADPGYTPDRNGLRKSMEDLFKMFPDVSTKVNFMMADSDRVTMQYTITGTNTGAMMGMPATGKKINVEGVNIVRFKDGKEVEHWGYMEDMKMMEQLGMMPGMGGGTDSTKAKAPDGDSKKM